jgi:isoleucyl-tRNA synthetase
VFLSLTKCNNDFGLKRNRPDFQLSTLIYYFRTSIKEKDKMSTKFTEYKGLDLPTVASEVSFLEENIFERV